MPYPSCALWQTKSKLAIDDSLDSQNLVALADNYELLSEGPENTCPRVLIIKYEEVAPGSWCPMLRSPR